MRKVSFLLAVALAVVSAGLWSCEKEDNVDSVVQDSVPANPDSDTLMVNWVDMGLPSGLLWAECNLGATKPEESGDYYAWGETQPKEVYSWSTYRYCTVDGDGDMQTLTKYNTSSECGTVDNLTTLQAMDDAATAKLGSGARIPTKAEWEELIARTTVEWTTLNGVNGWKFTASNGKTLFLSAAGSYDDIDFEFAGRCGIYWSSSLYESNPYRAWCFSFGSDGQNMYYNNRRYGLSVRPVRSAK